MTEQKHDDACGATRSDAGLGGTLWLAAGTTDDGKRVYLPDYAGQTANEVGMKVMARSYQEGFRGALAERLATLGWEIVCVRFDEVTPNA
jgi:hypothetical protein